MVGSVLVKKRISTKGVKKFEYSIEVTTEEGKRKRITKSGFATEREAKKAGQDALFEYNNRGDVQKKEMTYGDFLDYWLENVCRLEMKEITLLNYEKKIRLHIKPALGGFLLTRLDQQRLQKFLQEKHDAGYARNTMIVLKGILRKSLNSAVELKYLSVSPAVNLKIPRTEMTTVPTRSDPHVYLEKEQMDAIFQQFPEGKPDHLPLMIGYHCGLRIGEVFALTWENIDLERKELRVDRQVQWHQNKRSKAEKRKQNGSSSPDAGWWYFSQPKYKSCRTIELDDQLIELLQREHERQIAAESYFSGRYKRYYEDNAHRIGSESQGKEIHFLCVREDGSYINSRTMQYTSKIIHERLHMPEFDFHSLRHTHATMLELPVDDVFDINGWDLQKALRLLYRSNPSLFEWLSSPIIYKETEFAKRFRPLLNRYFSSRKGVYHYLSMAKNNYREYFRGDKVKAKKYFYVLRPILACYWILRTRQAPPMRFSELVDAELPEELKGDVAKLLELKMNHPELQLIPRVESIDRYLQESLDDLESRIRLLEDTHSGDWEELVRFFRRELNERTA